MSAAPAVGAPTAVGSSTCPRSDPNVELRIALYKTMASELNALGVSLNSLPQLRVELNLMRTTGKDHYGKPADPELIQSMEDLLTVVSRISAIFKMPAGSSAETFAYHKC